MNITKYGLWVVKKRVNKMTMYELWLESIAKTPRTQMFKLESKFPYALFKLIKTADLKNSDNYEYHSVTYHVWNTITCEWDAYTDYLTAYNHFKKISKLFEEDIK